MLNLAHLFSPNLANNGFQLVCHGPVTVPAVFTLGVSWTMGLHSIDIMKIKDTYIPDGKHSLKLNSIC